MEYLTDEDYAIALKNGIPRKIASWRFNNCGWSLERAITQPYHPWDKSLKRQYMDQCKKHGVPYRTFCDRIKRGNTPDQALKKKKPRLSKKDLQIAEKNGINAYTAKNRVYIYQWSVERAITEPVKRKVNYDGFNRY